MRVTLTRRVMFSAAHRHRRPEWSEAQNRATFGDCANPRSHGHSCTCDVTVSDDVDPLTGFVVDVGALDASARVTAVTVAEDDALWATRHAD